MTTRDQSDALQAAAGLRRQAVAHLCELIEIASVAGDEAALQRAAERVGEMAAEAGFEVELLRSAGAPVVYARIAAPPGAPTVLFYGHYDVQPADPIEAWTTPPFVPTIRDDAVYGRGAGDNKGQFLAHILAAQALVATGGAPVGIKLLIEGEEEIGSPSLEAVVAEHRDKLGCDVAVTADGPYHPDGRPVVIFGVRGLLYVEAVARGAGRDVHSGSRGGIAPTPARTLARALATLWDDAGRVTLPGFYDDVIPPTSRESELASALPFDEAAVRRELQLDSLPAAGKAPWNIIMFEPNVNIAGLTSGYSGPGAKTIVPHRAAAKLDIRLVADQDPAAVWGALRRHFAAHGIETTQLAAVPPSSTPLDTPFAEPVQRAVERAWRTTPWLQPRLGGTTPDHVFTRVLGVPSLLVPYAPADMRHHAPDEHIPVAALERGIRTSVALCLELGRDAGTD